MMLAWSGSGSASGLTSMSASAVSSSALRLADLFGALSTFALALGLALALALALAFASGSGSTTASAFALALGLAAFAHGSELSASCPRLQADATFGTSSVSFCWITFFARALRLGTASGSLAGSSASAMSPSSESSSVSFPCPRPRPRPFPRPLPRFNPARCSSAEMGFKPARTSSGRGTSHFSATSYQQE